MNIDNALILIKKDLETNWPELEFRFSNDGTKARAEGEIWVDGINHELHTFITVTPSGGASFVLGLGKIDKTPKVLELLNEYNSKGGLLKIVADKNNMLILSHGIICYDERMLTNYTSVFLNSFCDALENETIIKLNGYSYW